MRKLFLAVLVLNLVLWLWGRREAPEIVDGLLFPDIGVVRLVDESAVLRLAVRSAPQPEATVQRQRVPVGEPAAPTDLTHPAVQPAPAAEETLPASAVRVSDADLQPPASSEDGQDASAPPRRVQATTVLPVDGSEEAFGGATAAEGLAPPPSAEVSATPSELPVEPEAWSSRPGADDRQAVAAAPGVADADAPAPAAAAAEGETPAIPVDAEPAPTPVVDVRPVCEAVGPFAQRALAETFVASQPVAVASDGIREERVPRPARHWVLGPAQPNKEAVSAYLSALQAAGVKDAWRAQSGVFAGRLVVGVFSTDENARRHAAMLAGKGVATEIRKQQTDETRWWVDVRRGGDAASVHAPDGVQVVPRDCGRVAAP